MSNGTIFHALGLHMHQPPGNMQLLLEANPWEAQQIIHCYDRATRYAHKYPDTAHLHIGFSGTLLEQLRDTLIVERYREYMDIPAMLNSYREAKNIELIAMGYYHPIFPLIPQADWEEQLIAGRQIMQDTFGRAPKGFWPPEMAFSMEMIPALVKAGYEYVVVDSVHIRPKDGVNDIYQVYKASYGGASIAVVPRDRDMSNAQESGLDPAWFANETRHKAGASPRPDAPRLITTWSDGENGGWFRQMDEASGFFGHFFSPYMEYVQMGEYPVQPVSLSAFLKAHPPTVEAEVQTGAWNIGNKSGHDFSQWNGSDTQKHALAKIHQVSARYAALAHTAKTATARAHLQKARQLILESETSCFFFWGEHWLHQVHERVEAAESLLNEAEHPPKAVEKPKAAPAKQPEAPAPVKAEAPKPAPVKTENPTPVKPATPATVKAEAPAPVKTENPTPVKPATPATVKAEAPAPVKTDSPASAKPLTPPPMVKAEAPKPAPVKAEAPKPEPTEVEAEKPAAAPPAKTSSAKRATKKKK